MSTYIIRIDYADETIEAESLEDAKIQALALAEDSAMEPDADETYWIDAHIFQAAAKLATVTATIDPQEPDCEDDAPHAWGEDRASGHGGGVVVTHTCRTCGLTRTIDTWAQRPDTGEQGMHSVSYSRE